MKKHIDVTVNCVNSDFVRRQNSFNRKTAIMALLGVGYSVLLTLELKRLHGEIDELKKSKGEEM